MAMGSDSQAIVISALDRIGSPVRMLRRWWIGQAQGLYSLWEAFHDPRRGGVPTHVLKTQEPSYAEEVMMNSRPIPVRGWTARPRIPLIGPGLQKFPVCTVYATKAHRKARAPKARVAGAREDARPRSRCMIYV